eukprot:CAMPEP_0195101900 /NCGR_PEP_ID=MMETSP0448-20130528/65392_1 /TAXON_ID=66468 /ORGANISM="Heterocapsa triquestra, Strain CCMP 448" /LENGTH=121 /DNA_ID=CAMNT_0040137297 /DNA_START=132 /DNA_END=497 /DNA_ORIENTATION=+
MGCVCTRKVLELTSIDCGSLLGLGDTSAQMIADAKSPRAACTTYPTPRAQRVTQYIHYQGYEGRPGSALASLPYTSGSPCYSVAFRPTLAEWNSMQGRKPQYPETLPPMLVSTPAPRGSHM